MENLGEWGTQAEIFAIATLLKIQIFVFTVRGKILEGENFGEFDEWQAIRQNFPCQYL